MSWVYIEIFDFWLETENLSAIWDVIEIRQELETQAPIGSPLVSRRNFLSFFVSFVKLLYCIFCWRKQTSFVCVNVCKYVCVCVCHVCLSLWIRTDLSPKPEIRKGENSIHTWNNANPLCFLKALTVALRLIGLLAYRDPPALPPSAASPPSPSYDIIITAVSALISNVNIFHIDECAVCSYCALNALWPT